MSSLRNIVYVAFLSLIYFSAVDAKPIARRATSSLKLPSNVQPRSPQLTNTGPSSLPSPPSNLTLKHVTVGHGIQNYTCSSNLTAAPTALGAIATLYDVTPLAFLSSTTSSAIPALAAFLPLTNALVPNAPLTISGLGSFPILGFHFFDAKGTPIFDLNTVGERLASKKAGDIKAPSNASVGLDGTGAVDWLFLTSTGDAGSTGLGAVYRVDTAGGNPPTSCEGFAAGDVISVPYSAGYHFYG
ncbi:hypothetical protein D0Z07_2923 [Hyphodiscus hymeniophilus]|uniref:Malate dehydrogenase n=1 Tax=Hyphodiscus hymeniophilus TaxID=353542 RepID=A0A9P6VLW9_9HELO|nr:hypothetical protein D0Z07_2923 [Hyphodiscus hymeniophilus]